MRILVAYECSGAVRRAMAAKGHEVWSNDILPAEDKSPMHLQMDAWDAILNHGPWDMIFSFRPCTYLCGSGLHWNNRGRGWENTNADLADTQRFMDYCEERDIAYVLENPVGLIGTRIRPANQTIHPYYFGDDASKRTCLWLYKVKPLEIPPKKDWYPPPHRLRELPHKRTLSRRDSPEVLPAVRRQDYAALGEPDRQRPEPLRPKRLARWRQVAHIPRNRGRIRRGVGRRSMSTKYNGKRFCDQETVHGGHCRYTGTNIIGDKAYCKMHYRPPLEPGTIYVEVAQGATLIVNGVKVFGVAGGQVTHRFPVKIKDFEAALHGAHVRP